jgi:DNA replication protein
MMTEAIDFKYLLLDSYKKLNISEEELAVILMLDHLIVQGNGFITADMLSLKMNLANKQIDSILADLMKKKFMDFETYKGETITSLKPLKEKLYLEFDYHRKKEKEEDLDKKNEKGFKNVYEESEKLFKRTLSPVEISTIREWIEFGYSDEDIINAIKDALNKGKKSFKVVDQILLSYRIRDDRNSDGFSPINEDWNKDLEETIKIMKTPWLTNSKKR